MISLLQIDLLFVLIGDEIKFQGAVGKLENMEPTRLADISSVDLMTEEQKKELLRKLANQI